MPQPSDCERLLHMADALDWIAEFVTPLDFDEFRQDLKTRLSVERSLEIVGEAANHISQELKDRHPEIPWRQMSDLRNVVSHEYFQIRQEIIWQVATDEVPRVSAQLQQLLSDLKGKEEGCTTD